MRARISRSSSRCWTPRPCRNGVACGVGGGDERDPTGDRSTRLDPRRIAGDSQQETRTCMVSHHNARNTRTQRVDHVITLALLCGLSIVSLSLAATDYDNNGSSDIAFHRPGSTWNSAPVLFSNGDGSWRATNYQVPDWVNQPGVIAIAGDFNNDGKTDVAFIRPGSTWNSVPILFSNGDGSWRATNYPVPDWANQPGVIAIPGDFNHDGKTDLAFVRPGSTWNSVPILFSNGDGSWRATNYQAPDWANQHGVIAIPGDFNHDGKIDVAFVRPGSTWSSVPILFSNGDGSWRATNYQVPAWANQPGVVPIAGDFDHDGKTDVAFVRPGSTWNSAPILFSNGDGSWRATNYQVPAWANQPGVVPIAGDFDHDGKTDVAFVRPGSTWNSAPILFSNGDGSWRTTNYQVPAWANQPGVVPIAGDFDHDGKTDVAFIRPGSTWNSVPILFSNGDGSWRTTNYQVPAWAN